LHVTARFADDTVVLELGEELDAVSSRR